MEFKTYKLCDLLFALHSGGTPSTAEKTYWNGSYKWLSSGETSKKFIYDTLNYITEEGINNSSTKLANKGDIVMACAGQGKTRGQVSYLMSDMYVNQSVIVMKANERKLNSLYLYYNLSNRYFELRGGSDASSIRGSITTTSLKSLNIEAPNIDIQKKISSYLFSFDELIENNQKQIFALEQIADLLYKEWFVHFRFPGYEKEKFVEGLPETWNVLKVKNIVKRLSFGKTYKDNEVVLIGDVVVIDQSTNEVLGYHNGEPSHKADYINPILLFGDHSCKYQLMTIDFSLGENVIPYISNDSNSVNNYYLYFSTRNLIQTEEYKRHWSRLSNMKILIPDIELQNKFSSKIVGMKKEKDVLKKQIELLKQQRDLLLPRLMSGKLEIK